MAIFGRQVVKGSRGVRVGLAVVFALALCVLLMNQTYDFGYMLGQNLYKISH